LLDSRPGLSSKWKDYIHCPRNAGHPSYNRTLGAEFAYARPWTSEAQRADYLQRWLIHYNYHRAHTATGNQPPATLTPTTVTNVMMQNS
jgi:hypothetical protein